MKIKILSVSVVDSDGVTTDVTRQCVDSTKHMHIVSLVEYDEEKQYIEVPIPTPPKGECMKMWRCDTCERTGCFFRSGIVTNCEQYIGKPPTNADRIRAMSDEELEAFLIEVDLERAGSPFITEWGKWLQQPAEGE